MQPGGFRHDYGPTHGGYQNYHQSHHYDQYQQSPSNGLSVIVVLFILLIIIGCSGFCNPKKGRKGS